VQLLDDDSVPLEEQEELNAFLDEEGFETVDDDYARDQQDLREQEQMTVRSHHLRTALHAFGSLPLASLPRSPHTAHTRTMHQSEAVAQYEPVVAGVSLVEEGLFFDEDDDEEEDESEAAREAEEHNEEQRIATVKKEGEQYVAPCSSLMMTTMLLCVPFANELNAVVVLQVQGDSQEDREDLPPRAVPHDRRHPVGRPCQPARPSPPRNVPQRLFSLSFFAFSVIVIAPLVRLLDQRNDLGLCRLPM
jgi:hypothetical protein